jgi:predicted DNA binding CopG/RHH family protein
MRKGAMMRKIKLTKEEQWIEDHAEEFIPLRGQGYKRIVEALERRKKDAVLNIRVNRLDLEHIKQKARKMGIKYQSFISELLHRVAEG